MGVKIIYLALWSDDKLKNFSPLTEQQSESVGTTHMQQGPTLQTQIRVELSTSGVDRIM